MKSARVFMWTVIIFFAAALIFLGFLVSSRIDYYSYEKQIVTFVANGLENGAYAYTDDFSVKLNDNNFEVMAMKLFTITERKKISRFKVPASYNCLTIKVDENNLIKIIPSGNADNDTYLVTNLAGKKRYFKLTGNYRIYERAMQYASPEGFYGNNTLIIPE